MSRPLALLAQRTLEGQGYRIVEFLYIPRSSRGDEGWQIVVTGPHGDEFRARLGGVAVTAEALLHEARTMPPCAEFMASPEPPAA